MAKKIEPAAEDHGAANEPIEAVRARMTERLAREYARQRIERERRERRRALLRRLTSFRR